MTPEELAVLRKKLSAQRTISPFYRGPKMWRIMLGPVEGLPGDTCTARQSPTVHYRVTRILVPTDACAKVVGVSLDGRSLTIREQPSDDGTTNEIVFADEDTLVKPCRVIDVLLRFEREGRWDGAVEGVVERL
jgi:hypothetical protein